MYKQIIIVRKDLDLSPGKMSAQVSHASMAFLTDLIRKYSYKVTRGELEPWYARKRPDWDDIVGYDFVYTFDKDLYEQWIDGEFTKCVLQAKNKNKLLKAKIIAEELGMKEGEDYFCIYDNCHTELAPEEENGTTLTCIGFKPMDSDIIDQIGKKYQLYK